MNAKAVVLVAILILGLSYFDSLRTGTALINSIIPLAIMIFSVGLATTYFRKIYQKKEDPEAIYNGFIGIGAVALFLGGIVLYDPFKLMVPGNPVIFIFLGMALTAFIFIIIGAIMISRTNTIEMNKAK
jgi:hypothetical protein